MIWLVVLYLIAYDGDKIRIPLEREYHSFNDCQEAKELVEKKVSDYYPNPEADLKEIKVICITERPYGN